MRILCAVLAMCLYPELSWAQAKKVVVQRFVSPLKEEWKVNSYKFAQECEYETSTGKKNWGKHLGEDMNVLAGTKVYAIAPGKVAYADQMSHLGKSKDARNWGGIVVIGHWTSETEALYSLYGHIKLKPGLERGQYVNEGDELGEVAPSLSPENGWWEDSHLHLQICLDHKDVYRGGVLAGYAKDQAPNRLEDHMPASLLIKHFKPGMTINQMTKLK
jgi:murein DD-endopeptidase MepM/ murein hydrolase activator NlpD